MADSTEGDTEVQDLGLLPSALIALIAGLVIHSFIIGVNVNDWWKGRSVTPVDHIVASLGISRMCAQCALFLHMLVVTLSLGTVISSATLLIIDSVFTLFNYANIWLTSLLSVVFCLKISNLQTRLFLYLRRVVIQRTVHFIVASVLLSAINSIISLSMAISEVTKAGTYNMSIYCIFKNSVYNDTIGAVIPLLFYYISYVLLFTSLYHHTTRMKRSSNLTINLKTYYSAMKFVSFTFIYITIHFIGQFAYVFYYYIYCVHLLWFYIILDFLPVLHSSYLIYRTAKLRNQMSKALQNINDCMFQRKDT